MLRGLKNKISILVLTTMIITLFAPIASYASSTSYIIDKTIDRLFLEKSKDSELYNTIMDSQSLISNRLLLPVMYDGLSADEKSKAQSELGLTDQQIKDELRSLTSSDAQNIAYIVSLVGQEGASIQSVKSEASTIFVTTTPNTGGTTGVGGAIGVPVEVIVPEEEKEEVNDSKQDVIPTISFKDIAGLSSEAIEAIKFMTERNVLAGMGDGIFAPNESMTRAQFAKTLVLLFELEPVMDGLVANFTDVKDNDWHSDYVKIAYQNEIIKGKGNDKFAPNDLITRQEMAVMISRIINLKAPMLQVSPLEAVDILKDFNDRTEIAEYAYNAMALVVKNGVMRGRGNNIIDNKSNATRADAVVMLKRAFDLL